MDFYVPARWLQTHESEVPPVDASAASSVTTSTTTVPKNENQMWDFTLNKWVPSIMGTEDPEEEGPKIAILKRKPTPKKKKRKRKRSSPKKKQVKKKKK